MPDIEKITKAFLLMRDASFQSHSGHWDKEGTGGRNCPECIRSRELREEADMMFAEALKEPNSGQ